MEGINSDSLTDVVKNTIENAYTEYIRICHHNDDENEITTHPSTIESASSSDLDRSVIEAAEKINPILSDVISRIPKYIIFFYM